MRKGFTLVETMITVAIVCLLLAIAIPNIIKARDMARDTIKAEDLDMSLETYRAIKEEERRVKAKKARAKRVAARLDAKARLENPELYRLLTSDFEEECSEY